MAGPIKIIFTIGDDFFKILEEALGRPFAEAITETFRIGGRELEQRAKADIAASGGPDTKLWVNSLVVKVFPEKGISAQPAIFLNSKPRYSNIFEEGGEIRGFPKLWLPLNTVPTESKGGSVPKAFTPRQLKAKGVNLTTLGKTKKSKFLIGTNVRTTFKPPYSEFTVSQLRRGTNA